ATDINNDGRMDLFVANDTVQNFLFVNRGPDASGKTRWEEMALQAGVAFSENGQPRSGMGVDAGDLDNSGWQDLFVANVDQEMFSLYQNNKDETFSDVAYVHSISQATRLLSGWGLKYFDYDNDGATDLLLANGHPDDMIGRYSKQVRYKEPLLLFHQGADGKLRQRLKNNVGSYLSSHDLREVLGIGTATQVDELEIRWPAPSRRVDKFTNLAPNRYVRVVEGRGIT